MVNVLETLGKKVIDLQALVQTLYSVFDVALIQLVAQANFVPNVREHHGLLRLRVPRTGCRKEGILIPGLILSSPDPL